MPSPAAPPRSSSPLRNRDEPQTPRRALRPARALAGAVRRSYRIARTGFPLAWPTPKRAAATWRWGRRLAADVRRRRGESGLTVAVDISPLFDALTGVGWYLHELLRQLADRPGLRLRLYGPTMFTVPDGPRPVTALPQGRSLEWVRHEVPDDLLVRRTWLAPLMRVVEPCLVAADGNRVVFAPNFVPTRPLAAARRPLVATVHDLTLYRMPWTLLPETRADLERKLEPTIARARAIVTLSETVRTELVEHAGAEPGAVHAIWCAGRLDAPPPDDPPAGGPRAVGTGRPRTIQDEPLGGPPAGGPRAVGNGQPRTVRDAPPGGGPRTVGAGRPRTIRDAPPGDLPTGVPRRFVLHVGTIEPRKNVAALLAAWPRLRTRMPDAPPLVLCGKLGWGQESTERALARARDEGWLLWLGYAPDPTLRALYQRAAAVVCPSVYEGFGLPLVEAMAAGAPLVCSDIPVFREVAADAALFVPPADDDAWARALADVLSDPDRARALAARGAARVRAFSWRNTADQTLAVLSSAAGPA